LFWPAPPIRADNAVGFGLSIFSRQRAVAIARGVRQLCGNAAVPAVTPRIKPPVHQHFGGLGCQRDWSRTGPGPGQAIFCWDVSAAFGELRQSRLRPDLVHETYYYPHPGVPAARAVSFRFTTLRATFSGTVQNPTAHIPRWMGSSRCPCDHLSRVGIRARHALEMSTIRRPRIVTHPGHGPLVSLLVDYDAAIVRTLFTARQPYVL